MRLAMEECKADKGSCAAGNGIVGMVIGGRAARACDVCGKERARWYCAADLAYLCERCDGSVHSANAVANRHERVRLGPNGAPSKSAAQELQAAPQMATSVLLKRDATAAGTSSPAANLNPRKKPRSIRRHKPSFEHVSAHTHTSNIHMNTSCSSNFSTSFIYAPANHSIMIHNPRNDVDFIADNIIEFSKFVVKAEPLSPIDIGEQVKVPDHADDDPLFESLFDFRDLRDADLFLHQVPIYNPSQSRDNSHMGANDSKQYIENDKIELVMREDSKELSSPKSSSCAGAQLSELSPAELCSTSLPRSRDGEGNKDLMDAKCEEPERFVDSGTGVCDLDQLDFDSMLHGDDEDGDEESDMCAFHVDVNYMDASDCQRDDGSYGEDDHSCAHHGNGMDDDPVDDNYEAVEGGAASYGEAYDFDTMGSESPRTWLCKVKVESPSEFHDAMMHVDSGDAAEAFLREKLACKVDVQSGFKLGLKLNFEDVLHAWSGKGTFWMDGQPPHELDHCLDFLGGWLVPDLMSSTTTTEGDGRQQLVPVLDQKSRRGDGSAREASVLRYREKRRTRLFCKKIRYEVRKLNAEKRPRMKGRFVKRISIAV